MRDRTTSTTALAPPGARSARLVASARRWAHGAVRAARSVGTRRRELAIALSAYGAYAIVKGAFAGTLEEGLVNAADVVRWEHSLGIYVEPEVQRFFVEHGLGMPFWNWFYLGSQVIVLPATLFLVFHLAPNAYALIRNLAILSWSAGVVWYALQPVAPPRHADLGIADTISSQTSFDLDGAFARFFYNPVAAMPSLHVGMSPVAAWALWRLTPWAATRAIGLLYPLLVALTVVVTGNHYLLDIAGGLAVVLPAAAIARLVTGRPEIPPRARPHRRLVWPRRVLRRRR